MDHTLLFLELKQLLEKLGIELREQALELDSGKAKSGLVRVRDTKIVFLDSTLALEEKIKTLTQILKGFNLEGVYLSPYLRKWLEEEND